MTAWIFQCNPDHYDIDGLLATKTKEIFYAANQSADRMAPGDTVYIWRSQGKQKAVAGIVAKGRLLNSASERADDGPGSVFWIDPSNANLRQKRVGLSIEEVANKKEVIQRAWMLEDPILQDLTILKMANMSNYVVEGNQLKRIEELWENTTAQEVEQAVLRSFAKHQLPSNGEILQKVEVMEVQLAIISESGSTV